MTFPQVWKDTCNGSSSSDINKVHDTYLLNIGVVSTSQVLKGSLGDCLLHSMWAMAGCRSLMLDYANQGGCVPYLTQEGGMSSCVYCFL